MTEKQKKRMSKRKLLLVIPLAIVLAVTLLYLGPNRASFLNIVWAVGSTPDSYGNRICNIGIETWNTTAWNWNVNGWSYNGLGENYPAGITTDHNYDSASPFTWRVHEAGAGVGAGCSYPLNFRVVIYLNATLASDTTEAANDVQVYINITKAGYSLVNQLFPQGSGSGGPNTQVATLHNATYYRVVTCFQWNVTSHPIAGTAYGVVVWYNAYY